jgi:predicted dehydrogenase
MDSKRPIRVGIVGLGRLWTARHRPSLMRLRDRFEVVGVYDQVRRLAQQEARSIGCMAMPGLEALIRRPEIEALYVLTPQWFETYGLERAAATGKAVYCALPVRPDWPNLPASALVVPEMARRFYPATLRLRELLSTQLGRPRLVIGQARFQPFDRTSSPGPSTPNAPVPLDVEPGANLLDWCRCLFDEEPVTLQAFGAACAPGAVDDDFGGFTLHFPGGGVAQIHYIRWPGDVEPALPRPGIQVFTERGAAFLALPDHLVWTADRQKHDERLPAQPELGDVLNEHFYRKLTGESSLSPDWSDALAAGRLLRALQSSRASGCTIRLDQNTVSPSE